MSKNWFLTRKKEFVECEVVKTGRRAQTIKITEKGHALSGKHKTLPPDGVVVGKLYPRLFKADSKPVEFVEIGGRIVLKQNNPSKYMVPDELTYQFQKVAPAVIDSVLAGDKVLLTGEAGTGKTSMIEQIAARINQPVLRVNLNGETRLGDFIGRITVVSGEGGSVTQWNDGILPTAMKMGYWLILDEVDMGEPNILSLLHPVLEPNGRLILKENAGEEVKPHPNFRLFGTANGVGKQQDRADAYAGVNQMNEAFMDRWHVIAMPHMDEKTEIKILKDRLPLLLPKHAKQIVKFANLIRSGAENAVVNMTFSTRRCLQWAEKTAMYRHPMKAALAVFMDKASKEDTEVLTKLVGTVFGERYVTKKRAKKTTADAKDSSAPKRKRGRPRKNP